MTALPLLPAISALVAAWLGFTFSVILRWYSAGEHVPLYMSAMRRAMISYGATARLAIAPNNGRLMPSSTRRA